MKIRNGFVSNSSSSSFIVKNKEEFPFFDKKNEPKLTKKEIGLLEDYGFYRVRRPYASELEANQGKVETCKEEYNFGYWVVCNEDEVIEFLLKNKIPFTAATQYGHTHVFYDRGDDYMLVAENYGLSLEMYGHKPKYSALRLPTGKYGIRKVNIKKYLEGKEGL
jgi:hypothetical protein